MNQTYLLRTLALAALLTAAAAGFLPGSAPSASAECVKRNVVIEGRRYSEVRYSMTRKGRIRLHSLKTEEKTLRIPAKIDGHPVTELRASIGHAWTAGKKQTLKKLVVPEGVKRISRRVFRRLRAEKVILPASLKRVPEFAFRSSKVKSVRVKNKKAVLGRCAFVYSTLREIRLPKGYSGRVKSDCFRGTKIERFVWPRGAAYGKRERVEHSAFENCRSLKKVVFPKGQDLIYIPEQAFERCELLKELDFPADTGKVIYDGVNYADNYQKTVRTLIIRGANTELKGCMTPGWSRIYEEGEEKYETEDGYPLITVGKIVAPAGSRAIEFAKSAIKPGNYPAYYQKEADQGQSVFDDGTLDASHIYSVLYVPMEYEIL